MSARVFVVGVGNVFRRDDGFGVEVVRRLSAEALPDGVAVQDFGIRGLHLAFALLEPPELLVVVDVAARGEPPGTVFVLEPDLDAPSPAVADGHGMDLCAVFANVRGMGGRLPRVLVVGCEPACLDEGMGLSEVVAAAVEPTLAVVRDLLHRELHRNVILEGMR